MEERKLFGRNMEVDKRDNDLYNSFSGKFLIKVLGMKGILAKIDSEMTKNGLSFD